MQEAAFDYAPRHPESTVLYQVVAQELETFLRRQKERDHPVPRFVEEEFRSFLDCGILARFHGALVFADVLRHLPGQPFVRPRQITELFQVQRLLPLIIHEHVFNGLTAVSLAVIHDLLLQDVGSGNCPFIGIIVAPPPALL